MIKSDAQVDMNQFRRIFVDEDVGQMAVAESEDVADHGGCGGAAGVREPLFKPEGRRQVVLEKEVAKDGREAGANPIECGVTILQAGILVLELGQQLAAFLGRQVVRLAVAEVSTGFVVVSCAKKKTF